jgi:hypothetical protein
MTRLALLVLLCSGCKEQAVVVAPAAAPPDAAPPARALAPPRRAPDGAPRAAAAPADAAADDQGAAPRPGSGKVGVAVCDEYLDKMARCITRLSPEAQVPMKNAMVDSRKAWQANAATREGRSALDGTCRQALDAAKSAAAAMGCEW